MNVQSALFADQIYAEAGSFRTGQYLFNTLPPGAQYVIAQSLIDPFHRDLTKTEIYDWANDHLIFNGTEIVAVFFDNKILWEKN